MNKTENTYTIYPNGIISVTSTLVIYDDNGVEIGRGVPNTTTYEPVIRSKDQSLVKNTVDDPTTAALASVIWTDTLVSARTDFLSAIDTAEKAQVAAAASAMPVSDKASLNG